MGPRERTKGSSNDNSPTSRKVMPFFRRIDKRICSWSVRGTGNVTTCTAPDWFRSPRPKWLIGFTHFCTLNTVSSSAACGGIAPSRIVTSGGQIGQYSFSRTMLPTTRGPTYHLFYGQIKVRLSRPALRLPNEGSKWKLREARSNLLSTDRYSKSYVVALNVDNGRRNHRNTGEKVLISEHRGRGCCTIS